MENLPQKSAWTPTEANPTWVKPAFARCVMNYNNAYYADGRPNMNRKGYKPYYSLDWNNKTNRYDERAGIENLINRVIKYKPAQATGWASLYINLTLDLSTDSYNYEHKIAYFVGHDNKMPKFKPVFLYYTDGSVKIDITNTLLAVRELKEQMQIIKMARGGI